MSLQSQLSSAPMDFSQRLNLYTQNLGCIGDALIPNPGAPVVATTGGGSTTYSYKVVAVIGTSNSAASPAGTVTTGPSTLSATANNTITWNAILLATAYNIYRTAGGSAQGLIATVPAGSLTSIVDTGLGADGTTAPSLNTSGAISAVVFETITPYSATPAAISALGIAFITCASAAADTLAAPIAGPANTGGMDGAVLQIVDQGGHAHTITTPSNAINGNKHIATFGGSVGSSITLRAYNGVWYATGLSGVTLS